LVNTQLQSKKQQNSKQYSHYLSGMYLDFFQLVPVALWISTVNFTFCSGSNIRTDENSLSELLF